MEFKPVTVTEFEQARNASKRSQFLAAKPSAELAACRLYLSDDGRVGFAIDTAGDLQNVFNNGSFRGAGATAVATAVVLGARKLDCFDGFLVGFYARFGFKEVRRVAFDPAFAPEHWDYSHDGTPDVVYMELGRWPQAVHNLAGGVTKTLGRGA